MDTEELVKFAKSGNREAFDRLVLKWRGYTFSIAHRILGDVEQALDVSQEAFLRAYLALHSLRDPAAFPSWLGRIARNLALDARRSRKRESEAIGYMAERNPSFDEEESPVEDILQLLSPGERDLISLYLKGYSYAEISDSTGLKVSTIKNRLYHIRQTIIEEVREMVHKNHITVPMDRDVTVVLIDVVGFLRVAAETSVETSIEFLNELFCEAGEIATSSGGFIDKYMGDEMLLTFNGQRVCEEHELAAAQTAYLIDRRFSSLRDKWSEMHPVFNKVSLRYGINTGRVSVTKIGHPKNAEVTIIGDAVNCAVRLCYYSDGQILLMGSTHDKIRERIDAEEINLEESGKGYLYFRERGEPIYRLIGLKGVLPQVKPPDAIPLIKLERRRIALIAADLTDFTAVSGTLKPGEVVDLLNGYYSEIVEPLIDAGGTVDKYMGDCLLAYVDRGDESMGVAIEVAIAMEERLENLRKEWRRKKYSAAPDNQIAVHAGSVYIGEYGHPSRRSKTIFGDEVNTLFRLLRKRGINLEYREFEKYRQKLRGVKRGVNVIQLDS